MNLTDALLDSWDRQCRILTAVASRITPENQGAKPSDDGWDLLTQLAHIHKVRWEFLRNVAPDLAEGIDDGYAGGWEEPVVDLETAKSNLDKTAAAVREAVRRGLENGIEQFGWYDNPVLFLQHMIWHEGWHVGLIFLALRRAGQEPPQEWEEEKVWSEWRIEVWEG
ncbi:MAG: DinB family protein [Armatimonadetes bacterium]|nr:DinB family protein [Armatimonadota bacterium]